MSTRQKSWFQRCLLLFLGTKGRNKGEFTNLQGVAASSSGRILIADSNNQCVQVCHTVLAGCRVTCVRFETPQ